MAFLQLRRTQQRPTQWGTVRCSTLARGSTALRKSAQLRTCRCPGLPRTPPLRARAACRRLLRLRRRALLAARRRLLTMLGATRHLARLRVAWNSLLATAAVTALTPLRRRARLVRRLAAWMALHLSRVRRPCRPAHPLRLLPARALRRRPRRLARLPLSRRVGRRRRPWRPMPQPSA